MSVVQGPSAGVSLLLSLFLSRSTTFRKIWAIALVTLGFAACSDRVPEEVDEKSVQTQAHISFSYPQVFSRESLINDRLKEGQFLDDLLTKSVDVQFQPQLHRDLSTISSTAAQLGIASNPGAKLDFERSKQLDDIKQEPDQLSKLVSGSPRKAAETQSPEDRFKDLQVYRAALRSALNTAKLDDVHDQDGNALFRMQFIATVFPGIGQTKKQWGIARVAVNPPRLYRPAIERLYMRWLAHSTVRLNMIDIGERLIKEDPLYTALVNNTNLIGLMSLSPCVYNPIKSKDTKPSDRCISKPLLVATNPELLYDVKWLLVGRRYERLADMPLLLKQYFVDDPASSKLFKDALNAALARDQTCEFFNDDNLTNLPLWQNLPGTDQPLWQDSPETKSQDLIKNAKVRADTWQELFKQAKKVARINPFLITQNRHPMTTTPVKSACNAVIATSLRRQS